MNKRKELLKLFHGLLAVGSVEQNARYIAVVGEYLANKIKLEDAIAQLEAHTKEAA